MGLTGALLLLLSCQPLDSSLWPTICKNHSVLTYRDRTGQYDRVPYRLGSALRAGKHMELLNHANAVGTNTTGCQKCMRCFNMLQHTQPANETLPLLGSRFDAFVWKHEARSLLLRSSAVSAISLAMMQLQETQPHDSKFPRCFCSLIVRACVWILGRPHSRFAQNAMAHEPFRQTNLQRGTQWLFSSKLLDDVGNGCNMSVTCFLYLNCKIPNGTLYLSDLTHWLMQTNQPFGLWWLTFEPRATHCHWKCQPPRLPGGLPREFLQWRREATRQPPVSKWAQKLIKTSSWFDIGTCDWYCLICWYGLQMPLKSHFLDLFGWCLNSIAIVATKATMKL